MGLLRWFGLALMAGVLVGCANPGPPKPPSLHLPEAAGRLTAERVGDEVEVRFTVPQRTTDGLPLTQPQLTGTMCRVVRSAERVPGHGDTCVPATKATVPMRDTDGAAEVVTWRDTLPEGLREGDARVVGYRVQFLGADGKPGEMSDAVYAAAGAAPATVAGFRVEGSRAGTMVSWQAGEGQVLVKRVELEKDRGIGKGAAGKERGKQKGEPGVVWLRPGGEAGGSRMMDDSAAIGTAYSYAAVRQQTVQVGGRTLVLRSAMTEPVVFTLREIYPPAAPTGLTAAGFAGEPGSAQPGFAVDLVWLPVQDAKLAGYNVYRQPLDAGGSALGQRVRLNAAAVPLPTFHDATATAGTRYRYSVTAVDGKGNESAAVNAVLEP